MRIVLKIFVLLVSSLNFLSAQSKSDFKLRVENSFEKLYENPEVAIHAAKEIRNKENDIVIKDILARAYLIKGDYLESVKIAFEKSNLKRSDQEVLVKLIIAREFYYLNLYEQTSKIIAPLTSGTKISTKENELYAQIYQLESRNYIALKQFDKAEKSLFKSIAISKNDQNSYAYISAGNELRRATIALEKGNHQEAEKIADQLLKSLSSLPRAQYLFALTQQFRAQLFFENQDYNQAIECLKSGLTAIDKINYNPLKSSIYEDLAKNYLVIKKNNDYEFYKNKYTESSKILEENKKEARRELIQLSTNLTQENNRLILIKKKTNLLYIVGIALLFFSLTLYIFIREVQKSKNLMKQIRFFRTIKLNQSNENIKPKESQKKPLFIPKEKEEEILEGLQKFEDSKNFLDNKMSLPTLAGELNTNTKYLSEIINKYKDKNFNTYINELRVKHVIELLSEDRSYLQYKISYIAEVGGFTSHSAFTNIFKSVTGMSPNDYIQTLRQQS